MLTRKLSTICMLAIIFLLSSVTASRAAPPSQEGDDQGAALKMPHHPVAEALAQRLGVDYEVIISLHQQEYGFGQIVKAYILAGQLNNKTPQALLVEARQVGWGQLLKNSGIHPRAAGQGIKFGQVGSESPGQGLGKQLQNNGLHPGSAGQGHKFGHIKAGPPGQANRPAQFVPPGQNKKSN